MKTEKSIKYKEVSSFQQRLDFRYGKGVYKAIVILCLATLVMTSSGCGDSGGSGSSSGLSTPAPPSPDQQRALDTYLSATGTSTCSTGAATGGDVVLKKIKFLTDYDVCSDIVENFSDDKNFWVLKDGGDYYHWLLDRTTDPHDANKPAEIPITFESTKPIIFEATFEVVKDMPADPKIWVEDSQRGNAFIFSKPSGSISKSKGEYKLTFQSNVAFKDTVKYIEHFSLLFFNEADSDALVGRSCNRLYMTYGEPVHGLFTDDRTEEKDTLSLKHNANSDKKNILESFLYFGCKYADGKKTEQDIFDAIFDHFKDLKLQRPRHTTPHKHIGYWRGTSGLYGGGMERGVRAVLRTADARCGECTSFFINVCETQKITSVHKFAINTFLYKTDSLGNIVTNSLGRPIAYLGETAFLVKEWNSRAPKEPEDLGGKAQGSFNRTDKPLNIFWDHVFAIYNGRYYDPSYGLKSTKSFGDAPDLLNDYCDKALSGLVSAIMLNPAVAIAEAKAEAATATAVVAAAEAAAAATAPTVAATAKAAAAKVAAEDAAAAAAAAAPAGAAAAAAAEAEEATTGVAKGRRINDKYHTGKFLDVNRPYTPLPISALRFDYETKRGSLAPYFNIKINGSFIQLKK